MKKIKAKFIGCLLTALLFDIEFEKKYQVEIIKAHPLISLMTGVKYYIWIEKPKKKRFRYKSRVEMKNDWKFYLKGGERI